MNALQAFIASKPCGFLKDTDMASLIALDRLCPVLVRCGGCRFTCGAQDVPHLLRCIEAGGDYVRDVSFPVGALERAATWTPEPQFNPSPVESAPPGWTPPRNPRPRQRNQEGVDWICTGNFDGAACGTDAEGNL